MSTQLEQLKKKQEQLAARIQRLEAADKTRERKKDVRRKILLGAYVLERLKAGDERAEALRGGLDTYLTREGDRTLFGLTPLPEKKARLNKEQKQYKPESA